jgi:hypothetical protein
MPRSGHAALSASDRCRMTTYLRERGASKARADDIFETS